MKPFSRIAVEFREWVHVFCCVVLLAILGYAVLSVVYPSIVGLPSCSLVLCRIAGHSLSWVVVCGVGLTIGACDRNFALGALFALFLVFLVEDLFAILWILHGGSVYVLSPFWCIGLVLIVLSKPFRLHFDWKRFRLPALFVFGYFAVWFVFGFHTTYGDSGATLWVGDPLVNLVEICAYAVWGVAVLLAIRHVEKVTVV